MNRFGPNTALTSSETANLLAVHPSTVKRWCNDGDLPSESTPGGHRRISIDAAVAFAREKGIRTILAPFHPYEPHVWTALRGIEDSSSFESLHMLGLQWARRGDFERLEQLFLALGRSGTVPFCAFCDRGLRGLLHRVGDEWEGGRMRVGDEHMISQAATGALLTMRREWMDSRPGNGRQDRPVAVVGTLEGNHHALGALCVRILLERLGWTVYYPGPDVPIADFGVIQMSREASLVCISLPPTGTMGDVSRTLEVLGEHYDHARPYAVAFGGPSYLSLEGESREGPFESVSFFQECTTLRRAVEQGLGTRGYQG
ncbi:MAG: helix-turn-helix domain-containing protein [Longimicrobiales bacterium]